MDPEMVMQPGGIEWRVSETPVEYAAAVEEMEERVAAIRGGAAGELVWLLEHPPLFTAGTSADPAELFNPQGFPVYAAGRGGRYTYHGPGQRVGYVMLDLDRRGKDIRRSTPPGPARTMRSCSTRGACRCIAPAAAAAIPITDPASGSLM